ncbi:MAG: cysteine--tRNA ligase [Bacilli bacterium]|nr:cysteine--tRNA ligase [Bacilli bacterium]
MKIFNTLSGKIDEFKPMEDGKINMYVCGPTVYSYAHVGNMCPVIIFDMVYRYFKYSGYDVKYASNFTDVDDKIIKASIEQGISEKELTDKFIKIYLEDVKALNCLDIDYRPRVTETMDEIIAYIQLLMDKGFAYQAGDDVYFRVGKIKDYGKLSGQVVDDLAYGNRIDVDENKENPYDFVLWKKTKEGITWDSPFGKGRPGWHTECVVMINKLFGDKIDIHGGGVDLKFPHHENEIAQSEAAKGNSLANYWMHNGHVMVNGVKMSKSLGNFITARELLEKHNANAIRLSVLKTNYRLPFDFTDQLFVETESIDDKVRNALKQANLEIQLKGLEVGKLKKDPKINEIMDEDFNTSNLITYLLDLVKQLNNELRQKQDFVETYDKINLITYILGLKYDFVELTDEDKETYNKWLEYRNNKDFENADKMRAILMERKVI